MTANARVAVGLPVYDGENYLESTIDSILEQDLDDLELIIGDNGSSDGTEEICRGAQAADTRVRYLRSPVNRGATWNYNRLVAMTRAEYFKWAAHDDLLAPDFLRRCVEELETSPDAVLAYPRTVLIGAAGEVLDSDFWDGLDLRAADPLGRFRSYLVHSGEQHAVFGVIRTAALGRTGLIANCWGGDQVLLAELLVQGTFHEVPERLFLRRYHPGSSLVANRTPADVARWYDPSKRGRTALPRTRLTFELTRVSLRSPLPRSARLRGALAVATDWLPRYARVIGGELKRTVAASLASTFRAQRGSSNV